MLILEALRRADTAREICALMTKYVETLVSCDTARHLPPGVTALPVRGMRDTAARLACLLDLQDAELARAPGSHSVGIIEQATQLFREALLRLNSVDAADVGPFSFDCRVAAQPGISLPQ